MPGLIDCHADVVASMSPIAKLTVGKAFNRATTEQDRSRHTLPFMAAQVDSGGLPPNARAMRARRTL